MDYDLIALMRAWEAELAAGRVTPSLAFSLHDPTVRDVVLCATAGAHWPRAVAAFEDVGILPAGTARTAGWTRPPDDRDFPWLVDALTAAPPDRLDRRRLALRRVTAALAEHEPASPSLALAHAWAAWQTHRLTAADAARLPADDPDLLTTRLLAALRGGARR